MTLAHLLGSHVDVTIKVKHAQRETPFMLSIISDSTGAIKGVAGFEIGQKRPKRGKHFTLVNDSVKNWIAELEEITE